MNCAETKTDLDPDAAHLVIEPYFLALREIYIERGYGRSKRTDLYCAPWIHDSPRHFAACRDDGRAIIVAPELAEQDERIVLAVLAHELGHATDFLYPGSFALGKDRRALERDREDFNDDQWARWIRSWEGRNDDVVEFTADAIAEHVMGVKIGYVGPCKLQCFNLGVARPRGLR